MMNRRGLNLGRLGSQRVRTNERRGLVSIEVTAVGHYDHQSLRIENCALSKQLQVWLRVLVSMGTLAAHTLWPPSRSLAEKCQLKVGRRDLKALSRLRPMDILVWQPSTPFASFDRIGSLARRSSQDHT